MKRILTLLIATILSLPAFAAGKIEVPSDFAALYKSWDKAMASADTAVLEKLYANEVLFISPNGKRETKKEAIANLKSGDLKVANPSTEHLSFTQHGDIAIVTGEWKATETFKGEIKDVWYAYTDVWQKRSGTWMVIASQLTPVKPEGK